MSIKRLLQDVRMKDGSRRFGALPQSLSWFDVRDHVAELEGAELTRFVCDGITEAWICFEYRHHSFSINDQFGEYWIFVEDPTCENLLLLTVLDHFRQILY